MAPDKTFYTDMGVTRENRELFLYGYIEDDLEALLHDDEHETDEQEPIQQKRKSTTNKGIRKNKNLLNLDTGSGYRKRGNGAKQRRRCENLNCLLTMVEKDEIELDFNVVEPSASAFAELFAEREKMKAWNDFINHTEEEQTEMLQNMNQHARSPVVSQCSKQNTGNNNNGCDLDETWEEIPDQRVAHPAFSAEECFQRIDKNIKCLLKRRHVPLGILCSLEEDVIQFFTEWPGSVYVSKLASSYERMMLHALCQYLGLSSHSFDNGGTRQTQVENRSRKFCQPAVLLSTYLGKQHSS